MNLKTKLCIKWILPLLFNVCCYALIWPVVIRANEIEEITTFSRTTSASGTNDHIDHNASTTTNAIQGAQTTDDADTGQRQDQDSSRQTETFERIVIEGERISISCPHLVAQTSRRPNGSDDSLAKLAPGLQFGDPSDADENLSRKLNLGPEKEAQNRTVKWFRNHVPLPLNRRPIKSQSDECIDAKIDEATDGVKPIWIGSASEPDDNDHADHAETFRHSQGENQADSRAKESDELEPAKWFIDELDQLVISKVSRYLAGKYTCLGEGKQSEILLDVLVDLTPPIEPTNQSAGENGTNQSSSSSSLEAANLYGQRLGVSNPMARAHEKPIEWASSNYRPADDQNEQQAWKASVGGQQWAPHDRPETDAAANRMDPNWPGTPSRRLKRFNEPKELLDRQIGLTNAPPTHVIKSDTVQPSDLKMISGFLYTSRQLHCPLDWGPPMDALLGSVCQSSSASASVASIRDALNREQADECRRFAGSLIGSALKGNAGAKLLRLGWLKDSKPIEFEPNGRARDKELNVKLISVFEHFRPLSTSATSSSAGDSGNSTTRGAPIEAHVEMGTNEAGEQHSEWARDGANRWSHWPPIWSQKLQIDGLRGQKNSTRYSCALSLRLGQLRALLARQLEGQTSGRDRHSQRSDKRRELLELMASRVGELDANPFVLLQTFSLSLLELKANSSHLWSTITEASSAYTRRKEADFKRLKRRNLGGPNSLLNADSERQSEDKSHVDATDPNNDDDDDVDVDVDVESGSTFGLFAKNGASSWASNVGDAPKAGWLVGGSNVQSGEPSGQTSNYANQANSGPTEAPIGSNQMQANVENHSPYWQQQQQNAKRLPSSKLRRLYSDQQGANRAQEQRASVPSANATNGRALATHRLGTSAKLDQLAHKAPPPADKSQYYSAQFEGAKSIDASIMDDESINQSNGSERRAPDKSRANIAAKRLASLEKQSPATFGHGSSSKILLRTGSQQSESDSQSYSDSGRQNKIDIHDANSKRQPDQTSDWDFSYPSRKPNYKSHSQTDSSDRDTQYDDDDDVGLMWQASQFIYLHIKAISSVFGMEVDVEWSNERSNVSLAAEPDRSSARYTDGPSAGSLEMAPFATIEVLYGQNLELECVAHALGRLPDVKWYKRLNSRPDSETFGPHNSRSKARLINGHWFWPLADLNQLKPSNELLGPKPFVCSQTTTIYDDLANQTFTVINKLHLSQYNDYGDLLELPDEARMSPQASYNFYACIIDADVRHYYATLGVYFKQALGQLPIELSKRLRVAAASQSIGAILESNVGGHQQQPNGPSEDLALQTSSGSSFNIAGEPASVDKEFFSGYSSLRDNQIIFPLSPQNSWISIRNSTQLNSPLESTIGDHLTPPAFLTMLIALVLSFLLSLIYMTVKAYRVSAQQSPLDDILEPQQFSTFSTDLLPNSTSLFKQQPDCICSLDNHTLHRSNIILSKQQALYEAHIASYEQSCYSCNDLPGSSIAAQQHQHPSLREPSSQCSHCECESYQPCSSNCCRIVGTSFVNPLTVATDLNPINRFNVNMIENPLADDLV